MSRGAGSPHWGWTPPVRTLLTVSVSASALLLGWLSGPGGLGTAPDPALVVDPNTAPAGVLLALPRVGPVLAGRVVAERDRGPFRSLDDLDARVRGVGPATAEALRPYLRFDGR